MNADDPQITAYILDELDPVTRTLVEREIASSPELEREVEDLRAVAHTLALGFEGEPAAALSGSQRQFIFDALTDTGEFEREEDVVIAPVFFAQPAIWAGAAAVAAGVAMAFLFLINGKSGPADPPVAESPDPYATEEGYSFRIQIQRPDHVDGDSPVPSGHPDPAIAPSTPIEGPGSDRIASGDSRLLPPEIRPLSPNSPATPESPQTPDAPNVGEGVPGIDQPSRLLVLERGGEIKPHPENGVLELPTLPGTNSDPLTVRLLDSPWSDERVFAEVSIPSAPGPQADMISLALNPAVIQGYRLLSYEAGPDGRGRALYEFERAPAGPEGAPQKILDPRVAHPESGDPTTSGTEILSVEGIEIPDRGIAFENGDPLIQARMLAALIALREQELEVTGAAVPDLGTLEDRVRELPREPRQQLLRRLDALK